MAAKFNAKIPTAITGFATTSFLLPDAAVSQQVCEMLKKLAVAIPNMAGSGRTFTVDFVQ